MQSHNGLTRRDIGIIRRQTRCDQGAEGGDQRRVVQRLAGLAQRDPRQIAGGFRILRLCRGHRVAFGQRLRTFEIPFGLGQLYLGTLYRAFKRHRVQRRDLHAFLQELPFLCVEHHHAAADLERQVHCFQRCDLAEKDPLHLRRGAARLYQFDRPDRRGRARGGQVIGVLCNKRRREGGA